MMAVMSIKPKYASAIIRGIKRFEFRKTPLRKKPSLILIYSTKPFGSIVGWFKPGEIYADTPEEIWKKCGEYAGMSKEEFFSYYKNSKMAYAIEIKEVNAFQTAINPNLILTNFKPPQSFYYVPECRLVNSQIFANMVGMLTTVATQGIISNIQKAEKEWK